MIIKKSDVTLADVAARCGVSQMTVSRVLSGSANVKPDKAKKIRAMIAEMGYNPEINQAARRMALKRFDKKVLNQVIALFFPESLPTSSYFVRLYLGILDEVEKQNFGLLTHYSNSLLQADKPFPPLFMRGEIDGVIMLSNPGAQTYIKQLRENTPLGNNPVVTLIEPVSGCSNILTDDYNGGYLAASHLLDLGHRHLLYVEYKEYPHQQRLHGYHKAYKERNLNIAEYLHECPWDNDGVIAPDKLFIKFIQNHPEITGIVAPNDSIAIKMYQALKQINISIPERISLVGYDDAIPLLDSLGEYFLTTIALPLETVGREAVSLLIRQINGEDSENKQIILPVTLVIRSTTAPPWK
jgi:DNA-binding LacI/PurR family transcriptional regulator